MTKESNLKSSAPHNCLLCMNTGTLPDIVFYTFCDLEGPRYCDCSFGNRAFRKWCQGTTVQQALRKKRQKEIDKALEFSNIPKRWKEKSLETLEGQERIKQIVNQYLDNFGKFGSEGRGLYLWSHGSGRGKTHLLSALCQEVIKRHAAPSIFMSEEQIFMKIRESFDNPDVWEQERLQRFLKIRCLFIDDLGATKVTAWKNEVLTSLLDSRLNNALPTFFTSNYSPQDYGRLVSKSLVSPRPGRIPSRIYEMCRAFIIEVKGADWRLLRAQKERGEGEL